MTNIFDFSRGALLREERLPGARRLALLTERLEDERLAEMKEAALRKKREERFEKVPARHAIESALEKIAAEIYRDAFKSVEEACGTTKIMRRKTSWRDSTASWHEGPPPHEGVWLSLAAASARLCYFDGKYWHTNDTGKKEDAVKRELCLQGYQSQMQWFGHASDADGWIKWEGQQAKSPAPAGMRGQVWMVGGQAYGEHALRTFRWNHKGNDGDIIAYRPLP